MTLTKYMKECAKVAESIGFRDLLDPNDPYDIQDEMKVAYQTGQDPEEFINAAFAEDVAKQTADDDDYSSSMEEWDDEGL